MIDRMAKFLVNFDYLKFTNILLVLLNPNANVNVIVIVIVIEIQIIFQVIYSKTFNPKFHAKRFT